MLQVKGLNEKWAAAPTGSEQVSGEWLVKGRTAVNTPSTLESASQSCG